MVEIMTINEWKEKYPKLAKETLEILKTHEPILDYLKGRMKKVSISEKKIFDRASLPIRIVEATKSRIVSFSNEVRILDGKPLSEVSSQQRKAYMIQDNLRWRTADSSKEITENIKELNRISTKLSNMPKNVDDMKKNDRRILNNLMKRVWMF